MFASGERSRKWVLWEVLLLCPERRLVYDYEYDKKQRLLWISFLLQRRTTLQQVKGLLHKFSISVHLMLRKIKLTQKLFYYPLHFLSGHCFTVVHLFEFLSMIWLTYSHFRILNCHENIFSINLLSNWWFLQYPR